MAATAKRSKAEQQRLDDLENREAMVERAEINIAQMLNEAVDRAYRGEMAWGSGTNWAKMLDYLPDGASSCDPQDYSRGDFKPFWDNQQGHAMQRGCGRWFAYACPIGGGMAENLANYTLGRGLHPKFETKERYQTADGSAIAREVQEVLEEVLAANKWDTSLQREHYLTEQIEGEAALEIEGEGDEVFINYQDPSWIGEPMDPPDDGLDWKYGLATKFGRSRPEAYFVAPYNALDQSGIRLPDAFWYTKQGTPSLVKRGMSIYYPSFALLERAGVLSLRLAHGASIQASIAYIRQWMSEKATPGKIQANAAKNSTSKTIPNRDGTRREIRQANVMAGSVIDAPPGMNIQVGPLGSSNHNVLIAVAQFVIRLTGARKAMPEYMSTGDASNANYSSSLVAESPFIKGREADQARCRANLVDFYWNVIRVCCQIGLLDIPFGILKKQFKLTVPEVSLAARDRIAETTRLSMLVKEGALSKTDRAAAEGLNYKEQAAKIAQEAKEGPPVQTLDSQLIAALQSMVQDVASREVSAQSVRDLAAACFPTLDPVLLDSMFAKAAAAPPPAPIDPNSVASLKASLTPQAQ